MSRHPGAVYGTSKGSKPGQKHFYRRVWSASKWDEFVASRSEGTVAQVCTGGSQLGIARVDHDRSAPGVSIVAEFQHLPFRDDSFDVVACDPPYDLHNPDRVKLQRELTRIARRRLLFKAPWIPRATGWRLEETVLLASHTCANVAVLTMLACVAKPLRFL